MDYFTNNKILKIAFLLLIVTNVAALTTIALNGFKPDIKRINPSPDHPGSEIPNMTKFIKDEMDFNADQKKKFEDLRLNYFYASKPRMDSLREGKLKIIGELAKENPDKNLIYSESEKIGKLQSKIETLNADFFISVYQISDVSQKNKLSIFLKNLKIQKEPDSNRPPPPVFN